MKEFRDKYITTAPFVKMKLTHVVNGHMHFLGGSKGVKILIIAPPSHHTFEIWTDQHVLNVMARCSDARLFVNDDEVKWTFEQVNINGVETMREI